jgi:hypothetical protein
VALGVELQTQTGDGFGFSCIIERERAADRRMVALNEMLFNARWPFDLSTMYVYHSEGTTDRYNDRQHNSNLYSRIRHTSNPVNEFNHNPILFSNSPNNLSILSLPPSLKAASTPLLANLTTSLLPNPNSFAAMKYSFDSALSKTPTSSVPNAIGHSVCIHSPK